jgi:prepilin-type N-terminal cleavage/methylation domain-containing protein
MNNKELKGFTLIELLVVVLIIGILAAIVLPKYNQAVEKSKLTQIIPTVKAIKDSAELHYLTYGKYEDDSINLILNDIPGCNASSGGQFLCKNTACDLLWGSGEAIVCKVGSAKNNSTDFSTGYLIWLDHSSRKGQHECHANASNGTANKVCQSIGGELTKTEICRPMYINTTCNIYKL